MNHVARSRLRHEKGDSAFSRSIGGLAKVANLLVQILSAEFIFRWMPNGGTAVLIRSIFVTFLIYLPAIGLKSATSANTELEFYWPAFLSLVSDTIPWFGAIFAGVYAALYSRFSAQWQYLAGLYNQLLAATVPLPYAERTTNTSLNNWRAGFIEDAIVLHLATKPMFAFIILELLKMPEVALAFEKTTPDGKNSIRKLRKRLGRVK